MVATSLGTSRGTPGYPGGSPKGSAGEAGPMPPRPLRTRRARRQTPDVVAPFHRGKRLAPIRNSSTARAHCRPSRIAQTTSDWPRRMSPAANSLGTEVR
jgi:hypothetical protein